jgi:hypothetical protein
MNLTSLVDFVCAVIASGIVTKFEQDMIVLLMGLLLHRRGEVKPLLNETFVTAIPKAHNRIIMLYLPIGLFRWYLL